MVTDPRRPVAAMWEKVRFHHRGRRAALTSSRTHRRLAKIQRRTRTRAHVLPKWQRLQLPGFTGWRRQSGHAGGFPDRYPLGFRSHRLFRDMQATTLDEVDVLTEVADCAQFKRHPPPPLMDAPVVLDMFPEIGARNDANPAPVCAGRS